jgi:hypothetical protein
MKGRFCFGLFAMLWLCSVAVAQITVTADHIPSVGSAYLMHASLDSVPVNLGSGGANQIWNFANATWWDPITINVISPTTTPRNSLFPTATLCLQQTYQDTIREFDYKRLTSNGYYALGEDMIRWGANVYDAPSLEIPFPLTYPGSWTQTRSITIGSDPAIIDLDTTVHTVDGWGTVNTPFGSTQALRVFSRSHSISMIGSQVLSSYYTVYYSWIDERGLEVVSINDGGDNPNFTSGYLWIQGLGTTAAQPPRGPIARGFSVEQNYPNPFNPNTTIPITLDKPARVSMDIYNEVGQLISHEEHDMVAGTHDLAFDGSKWASGTYFTRVSTPVQSQTLKMTLLK